MKKFDVVATDQRGTPTRCSICGEVAPIVHLPVTRKTGDDPGLWLGICLSCVEAMRRALVVGGSPS